MTLNRWFVVLASTATLAACSDAVAPAPDKGQFTARWAGTEWIGEASAAIHSLPGTGETLTVFARRVAPGIGEEQITASIPFTGPGKYYLAPGKAYLQQIVGGDGISGVYTNTIESPGVLEITGYGSDGLIEGELSFEGKFTGTVAGYGAKAKLEGGRFRAVLGFFP